MARKQPLMKVLLLRVGVRKTAAVLEFVISWEMARNELGDDMTLEQYQQFWKVSRATAFRDQQLFREALGDWFRTPADLLNAAHEQNVTWQKMRFA